MVDELLTPRGHASHPDSLARVLEDWHFDETPVKSEHWDERKPSTPADSNPSLRHGLRAKDKPDRIILDGKLVDVPSTLPTKLAFSKEMVQTEPPEYLEDSFNTQTLGNITIGFISAIDEHPPIEERAGARGAGVAFRSSVQTGLERVETGGRTEGPDGKLSRRLPDPAPAWPPASSESLPTPRYVPARRRNVVTFQKLFDSTSTADNDVYTVLAKVRFVFFRASPESAQPIVIWQMSISCVAHQARHFVLCDFKCWQYGTLVPQVATDDVGVGKFDIIVSPLLPFTSTPCIAQFKARLLYNDATVQDIARERIAVVVAKYAQAKRTKSSSEAPASAGTPSRGSYSLLDLPNIGGSSSDGSRGGASPVRRVGSLADLSLASSFILSFPDRSTPLDPIFRRTRNSQPCSDESFGFDVAPDLAYSVDSLGSLDSLDSVQPKSSRITGSKATASAAPLMLQLCREIGRGSTSIAYLAPLR
ncbi:hypothetical protein JCM10296v2_000876 [Rhodotorula toruloides]